MTAPSSLAFPGSRTLAGWWRQVAPLCPRALWVGHLFLHQVEALVASASSQALGSLDRFVLQAVAAAEGECPAESPASTGFLPLLNTRLHLGSGFLRQALRALAAEALVETRGHDAWAVTAQGRAALDSGVFPQMRQQRRVFHFVETRYLSAGHPSSEDPSPTPAAGASGSPPHFLDVNGSAGVPCSVGDDWSFDIRLLEASVRQPATWKKLYGFPEDVREILGPAASAPAAPAWQRVVVDRPERLPVLLALTEGADREPCLQGFAVRQEGWHVHASHPVITLRGSWHGPFPDLADKPSESACRLAWQSWCMARGLPPEEVNACSILPEGVRLRVKAPSVLVERLRVSRSDALKGEAWLLVGEGALRLALLLDMAESAEY